MSYLVLARKYRPQTFDQVVKQEHVTRTLMNAISSDRVAHAILFSGPRGTGKTTVARILAKAMNCQKGPAPTPCNECRSCLEITSGSAVDVFEVDGASNNSVDQIRDLRENVKYMPAHSPYKIYIIDEVHMLSIAAFNALLKTLEEPPSHVMFVFATTEPHKIPITILSRCQRHDFRRINLESISKHMHMICERESVDISDESLWLIARESGGSMRDALSLLDQVMICSEGTIAHHQVLDILGVIDRKIIFGFSDAILRKDISEILDMLDEIYNRGQDLKKMFADFIEHFRNLLIVKFGKKIGKLVDLPGHEIDLMREQTADVSAAFLNQIFDLLYKEEAGVRFATQPKLAIEKTFFRIFQIKPALPIDVLIDKLDALRREVYEEPGKDEDYDASVREDGIPKDAGLEPRMENLAKTSMGPDQREKASAPRQERTAAYGQDLDMTWKKILETVSEESPSLAASLGKGILKNLTAQSAEIEVKGNGFSLNMVRRDKNMAILRRIFRDLFGKPMDLTIKTEKTGDEKNIQKKSRDNQLKQEALNHPLVTDTIEIFRGKVVEVKIL